MRIFLKYNASKALTRKKTCRAKRLHTELVEQKSRNSFALVKQSKISLNRREQKRTKGGRPGEDAKKAEQR